MLRQPRPLIPFAQPRRWSAGYASKVLGTQTAHLLAYWKLDETSGSSAADASGHARAGTYNGPTLGGATFLDGTPAASFDGVNDFVDVSALVSALNLTTGTAMCFAKVASSAVWTDGVSRLIFSFGSTSTGSRINWQSLSSGNLLRFRYDGNAKNQASSETGWFHIAITWNKTADRMRGYYNGTLSNSDSGLGTVSLNALYMCIGATATDGSDPWKGGIAHLPVWDTELTAAEVAALASV